MECVKDPSYNCEKNRTKESGDHECCSQKGNEGRLGIFVRKGYCDKTRGLPMKGCKDPSNKFVPNESYENFTIVSKEGYENQNCNYSNWENAFLVLSIVIMALVFLGASMYMQMLKNR